MQVVGYDESHPLVAAGSAPGGASNVKSNVLVVGTVVRLMIVNVPRRRSSVTVAVFVPVDVARRRSCSPPAPHSGVPPGSVGVPGTTTVFVVVALDRSSCT